jgi:beta,beta-carotene 9',10'-dioxygenase
MPNTSSFAYGAGFRSLTREIADPVALPVKGKLPSWLEGTLLRTGPSKFEVGTRTYNHWFDGLAMLHRFAFVGGGVSYANRLLKSKAFCAAEATGKIAFGEFATDPCWTLFGRVAAFFNPKLTDNCCVNVADYAGAATAFTETSIPVRFSPTRSRRSACSATNPRSPASSQPRTRITTQSGHVITTTSRI